MGDRVFRVPTFYPGQSCHLTASISFSKIDEAFDKIQPHSSVHLLTVCQQKYFILQFEAKIRLALPPTLYFPIPPPKKNSSTP